jgi:hypothetical protein
MKLPRLRVGEHLAFVGFVAIDLAASRAYISRDECFGWNLGCLLSVLPIGFALQIAFLRLLRSQEKDLISWLGFLAGGIVAISFVIWGLSDPSSETTTFSTSGPVVRTSYPGCFSTRLRGIYEEYVYKALERVNYPYVDGATGIGDSITEAAVSFLPQLLIAWFGGRFALLVFRQRLRTFT